MKISPHNAVYMAKEYYPHPHHKEVFAVRYFDKNKQEIAYYLPDMGDVSLQTFDPPRVWGETMLFRIDLQKINSA